MQLSHDVMKRRYVYTDYTEPNRFVVREVHPMSIVEGSMANVELMLIVDFSRSCLHKIPLVLLPSQLIVADIVIGGPRSVIVAIHEIIIISIGVEQIESNWN